ncbi:MAG: DNA mismatch repair protein MutL, partial [Oscillospiraceae bacterium]|nr:DNA mismatch repair protein MutL [Oscillospiraceae bacterium]
RGEALASISSVARVELLTKTKEEATGSRYVIEGGIETDFEEIGCPEGTTVIIRDLFYNTPARMKFLKKDVSEASAVAAVLDAVALSHPEIAVRFIKDSKPALTTSGDGKLTSAIYSVLGREFSSGLIEADSSTAGIRVSGMISKPVYCRPTRSAQYFFLNNRFIRSGVIAKALDQAYKNTVMVGKFPACVLNIEIPFNRVDVNVHPAKTEVRFSDERAVFEAVYYAVKNALSKGDTRPELSLETKPIKKSVEPFGRMTTEEYKKLDTTPKSEPTPAEVVYGIGKTKPMFSQLKDFSKPLVSNTTVNVSYSEKPKTAAPIAQPMIEKEEVTPKKVKPYEQIINAVFDDDTKYETAAFIEDTRLDFKYIGEAYRTYLIVQYKGSLWFIDKHAAHERILYDKLKCEGVTEVQALLSPVSVTLSREEHRAVLDNLELLKQNGFEVEDFGSAAVVVRAVPACLLKSDIMFLMCDIAANLVKTGRAETEILDDLYHNIACRSAIKGGNMQSPAELEEFARRILSDESVMYCPHGRPVAFELKRSELEKQFGRTK